MILAREGASIWFITGTLLSNGTKKLAGFVKCWDATAIAMQLHELLNPNLKKEIGICYNKVFSSKIIMDADKKDINNLVDLTNYCIKLKARGITEIMLILGIQQRGDIKFRKKKILKLLPPISKTEWVDFLSESLSDRYQTYYSQDLEKMENIEKISWANQAKPDMKALSSCLELMRMSRIYASISGLLEIPGYWSEDELKKA